MGSDERRTNQRVSSSFKVDCINEGDYIISFSRDLSVDGMFLCTDIPPDVGNCPKLIFTIGDLDEVEVNARVVWVNTSEPAKYMGMGVQFIDPPSNLQDAILQIVNRIAVFENGTDIF
ncbi:MAG: PilZ domain-containing protein [Thermodesulfobacteriota bacterium]|nr:PilZ domain-containing protein [Thermodesulfobacteriota bacterium]